MKVLRKITLISICSFMAMAFLTTAGHAIKPYTANGRIFYKSTIGGVVNIASMTKNGQNKKIITNNDGSYDYPFLVISPNGKKLAYIAKDENTYQYSAYVVNDDGSNPKEIIPAGNNINSLAWSPDGEKIAYDSSDELGYSYVKTAGVNTPNSTTLPIDLSGDDYIYKEILNIAWSVNDNLALILNDNLIYSVGTNGSNLQVLTSDDSWPYSRPTSVAWSPDGKKIVFTADECGSPKSCIVTMNANGSNKNTIVNRTERSKDDSRYILYPVNASWSPDGKKIIFAKKTDGGVFD